MPELDDARTWRDELRDERPPSELSPAEMSDARIRALLHVVVERRDAAADAGDRAGAGVWNDYLRVLAAERDARAALGWEIDGIG